MYGPILGPIKHVSCETARRVVTAWDSKSRHEGRTYHVSGFVCRSRPPGPVTTRCVAGTRLVVFYSD
jgi:hypothetical protein